MDWKLFNHCCNGADIETSPHSGGKHLAKHVAKHVGAKLHFILRLFSKELENHYMDVDFHLAGVRNVQINYRK